MDAAGSAIGIASVGIQICQGLFAYYDSWKDYNSDITSTQCSIDNLRSTLTSLKNSLDDGNLDLEKTEQVQRCLQASEKSLNKLSNKAQKLRKYKAPEGYRQRTRTELQRSWYPFRAGTVAKLRDIAGDIQNGLQIALQALQFDVTLKTQNTMSDIDARTKVIEAQHQQLLDAQQSDRSEETHALARQRHEPQTGSKYHGLSLRQQANDKQYRSLRELDKLEEFIISSIDSYDQVFLLLDALDECPEENYVQQIVLERLEQLTRRASKLQILATSRESRNVRDSMRILRAVSISITSRSVDDDIRKYISRELLRDRRFRQLNLATKTQVERTIAEKADGMFIWAHYQLQELKSLKSTRPKYVQEALRALPASLDETYERMLLNIEQMYKTEALVLLRWLAYAQMPLSLGELDEAAIVDPAAKGNVELDERGELHNLLDILSGLVIVEEANEIIYVYKYTIEDISSVVDLENSNQKIGKDTRIRLAHFSVKEYLESKRILCRNAKDFYMESAREHRFLAQSCVTYLMHYSSSSNKSSTEDDLKKFPLLLYAAQSWFYHSSLHNGDVTREASLLRSEDAMYGWLLVHRPDRTWELAFKHVESNTAGLYYASVLGLDAIVQDLLDFGSDVHAQGGRYGNALQAASARGHVQVAMILINAGADVNAHGGYHSNALSAATIEDRVKVAQLLLDHGAVLVTDHNNMTALHYTILHGREDIAQLMLAAGASVDHSIRRKMRQPKANKDKVIWEPQSDQELEHGLTPLHFAVLTGSTAMTRFFIDQRVNPNAKSEHGETPLHIAIKRKIEGPDWIRGPVDHWNDPEYRIDYLLDLVGLDETDEEFRRVKTIVETAHSEVFDELFEHDKIDFSVRDSSGSGLLHDLPYDMPWSTTMLEELLQKCTEIYQQNSLGQTALQLACLEKNIDAIQLLIDHGAHIQDVDKEGRNSLHYGACSADGQTMQLILRNVPEVQLESFAKTQDHRGNNALHCLLGGDRYVNLDAVECLITSGIDPNDLNGSGESPLSKIMRKSFDRSSHKAQIADRLFRAGADPSFRTVENRLNLGHLAASADEIGIELLQVLDKYGVDLNAEDDNGRTILHHCALAGSLDERDASRFLCESIGLPRDGRDRFGKTPLEIATEERLKVRNPDLYESDRWCRTEKLLSERDIPVSR